MNTFYVSIKKQVNRQVAIALCALAILSPANSVMATNKIEQVQSATPQDTLVDGDNLALGKVVTCSSAPEPENKCTNTVDGDLSNRWSAQTYPQSFEVDLGSVQQVRRVIVYAYQNRAYQYVVEVKNSLEATYTAVVDRTANQQDGIILEDTFSAVAARYVRVRVLGAVGYTGDWVSIREFAVFATPHPTSTLTFCPARFSKDIPLGDIGWAGSYPSSFVEMNGTAYFAAYDGASGLELWRTDGTDAGTWRVKDINPGYGSAFMTSYSYYNSVSFHKIQDQLLFFAYEGDSTRSITRLWRSDGTTSGTYPISPPLSEAISITDFHGNFYFWANDGAQPGLWTSDGTVQGTRFVKTMDKYVSNILSMNDAFYFVTPSKLWRSDGTTAGTQPILEGKEIREIVATTDKLFLSIYSGTSTDLWTSDGTGAGTNFLKTVNPFSDVITEGGTSRFSPSLTIVGDHIFLIGYQEQTGYELWVSDGTTNGTGLVKDVNSGSAVEIPYAGMWSFNNMLVFVVDDGVHGYDLWKSDGTANGTGLVKDVSSGSADKIPYAGMWSFNNMLVFVVDDGVHGYDLWKSDGTSTGTQLIKDLFPGSETGFVTVNYQDSNTLFFEGIDGSANQMQLWKLDAPSMNTSMVMDLPSLDGLFKNFVKSQGIYCFIGSDTEHGPELWRTDGTEAGTKIVKDIWPGSNPGFHNMGTPALYSLPSLFTFNGKLFFSADDGVHSGELWSSDGTEPGTQMVKDINRYREGMPPLTDTLYNRYISSHVLMGTDTLLYFTVPNRFSSPGSTLWRSDGSESGTQRIFPSIGNDSETWISDHGQVGDLLFFLADSVTNAGIWQTDGSVSGTHLVAPQPARMVLVGDSIYFIEAHLEPPPIVYTLWKLDPLSNTKTKVKTFTENYSVDFYLFSIDGALYLVHDQVDTLSLWKSNDAISDLSLVKTIPGQRSSDGSAFRSVIGDGRGNIYFTIRDYYTNIYALWRSDGTESGTFLLKNDQHVLPKWSTANGLLLFSDRDTAHGEELWTTDGTIPGTQLLNDIHPGPLDSNLQWMTTISNTIYFQANDGVHGAELWKSDGSEAGTIMIADIDPGQLGSAPSSITPLADGTVIFSAFSDANGVELWHSDGTPLGTQPLTEINPGVDNANPSELTWAGNRLYFRADTIPNGNDIWSIEVTSNGTDACQGISRVFLPAVFR